MNPAIYLYHQFQFAAIEISNKTIDYLLPAKMQAI